ncbi:four helix bundle protein [Legionella impletisoli]|uniref:Four helix bundle protein n=1 Tax=Legionella impletisoli TaxID=343510 RepID=A0A917JVQ3_9GAMM|nr:four helix bundle protein [Legionella impletisoli]GGI86899.1 four helix bundle protein [Legionella impletisoli]
MVQRVEELKVFQRAYKISLEIHKVSLQFPQIEQFSLADQIRRASKSICSNLAEGFAKQKSKVEFRRYIYISLGSTDEMRIWLRYCFDLGYIEKSIWQAWRDEYEQIAKMLVGLIKHQTNALILDT